MDAVMRSDHPGEHHHRNDHDIATTVMTNEIGIILGVTMVTVTRMMTEAVVVQIETIDMTEKRAAVQREDTAVMIEVGIETEIETGIAPKRV